MLLPHIQRALELRARLARDRESASLTRAALSVSPVGVVLVDSQLRVAFANDLAGKLLSTPGAGLSLRSAEPKAIAALRLVAPSRPAADALSRFVASVVSGGPGGALRVAGASSVAIAVLISPTPPGLMAEIAFETSGQRTAMITLRPLRESASPPPELLYDLFGLTRAEAEAEVAVALAGGGTAEEVARGRGVSLVTVRTQIRSILSKSESENLRDFEREMASLGALAGSGATNTHR